MVSALLGGVRRDADVKLSTRDVSGKLLFSLVAYVVMFVCQNSPY